jgi:hypothetical protein
MKDETRGCKRCRSSPETIVQVRPLFDSSHSSFDLCRCSACGQNYLKQFHEIIVWEGGGDDVWFYWEPLTKKEAAEVSVKWPWNRLAEMMHRRGRLVQQNGEIYWSDDKYSAGDLLPPG